LEYALQDPLYSFAVLIRQIKILCLVILFEGDKKAKLHSMVRGIKDGMTKKMGKRER
jgi:hypothetical protein